MPIPALLIPAAIIAGLSGVGASAYGAKKMYDAKETMDLAKRMYDRAKEMAEWENKAAINLMDEIGKFELEVIASFQSFQDTIEKIQNRPEIDRLDHRGMKIERFSAEELKEAYVGAAVLLGGLGGAGMGAAAGFAASGATTATVMAFGAASTGTAISSLSGVAATNAVLAWLGGGALAAGGGGMALGTAVLGGATLGVGLLIGGAVFAFTGSKMSDKADEAWHQARRVEEAANGIKSRMTEIRASGQQFYDALRMMNDLYQESLGKLTTIVDVEGKRDFNHYTEEEQTITNNTVDLVGLLYAFCKVKLTINSSDDPDTKVANTVAISEAIENAKSTLREIGLAS